MPSAKLGVSQHQRYTSVVSQNFKHFTNLNISIINWMGNISPYFNTPVHLQFQFNVQYEVNLMLLVDLLTALRHIPVMKPTPDLRTTFLCFATKITTTRMFYSLAEEARKTKTRVFL